MKKIIVSVVAIIALWYLMDSSSNEVAKQQYTFDLMCANETGSEALKKEAKRLNKLLVENGVTMNENELTSTVNHWLRMYEMNSYQELTQLPEFIMNCEYNACVYEGLKSEVCIQKKVDSCLENGFSYNECFPKE